MSAETWPCAPAMGVLTPNRAAAPRAMRALWAWLNPVDCETLLLIWSKRLRLSPNCSKPLRVVPWTLWLERRVAIALVKDSARTLEWWVCAATDSLRAAVTCRLASWTSCSETRVDITRERVALVAQQAHGRAPAKHTCRE